MQHDRAPSEHITCDIPEVEAKLVALEEEGALLALVDAIAG